MMPGSRGRPRAAAAPAETSADPNPWNYAEALYEDEGATLDELREAVTTLEGAITIARRVLGNTNPLTPAIEQSLRNAQAALRARETPQPPPPSESV